ncbi:MAG: dihydrodipicolinate reductase C-terminal domain-containing protein [Candidatus Buchananbacteria bacterium]
MINGQPGKMAREIAKLLKSDERFGIVPYSLTGPEVSDARHDDITLYHSNQLSIGFWQRLKAEYPGFIIVDFTHPSAVNANAELYHSLGLNFVMGTTGGDREALARLFGNNDDVSCAVIAPNMAKQVVLFQAMLKFAADNFPEAFEGYQLEIRESHQQGKADTSATAKAMVAHFNALGIPFRAEQIIMVRDRETQLSMGVPETALTGHGFHTYTLRSGDGNVVFQFTHNVSGRIVYAEGTRDAILFLHKKVIEGAKGRVYSMIDVLKGK